MNIKADLASGRLDLIGEGEAHPASKRQERVIVCYQGFVACCGNLSGDNVIAVCRSS